MTERQMSKPVNNNIRTRTTSSPHGRTDRQNGVAGKPRLDNIPSVESTTETSYF